MPFDTQIKARYNLQQQDQTAENCNWNIYEESKCSKNKKAPEKDTEQTIIN